MAKATGGVIRLRCSDWDAFVEASRIEPGNRSPHLYPEVKGDDED